MKIELLTTTYNPISQTKLVTVLFDSKIFTFNDNNLEELRTHCFYKNIEFQIIAEMLYDLYQEADFKETKYHIPFEDEILNKYEIDYLLQDILQERNLEVNDINWDNVWYEILMKISASMCAKLSYNTQDNEDTLEKHLERANMLIEHKHQEPFSHQAVAMDDWDYCNYCKSKVVSKEVFIKNKHIVASNQKYDKIRVNEYGWCYNLRGFISQRYILENY